MYKSHSSHETKGKKVNNPIFEQEKYSKNGVQKEVHIVVKNAAFTVICQLVDIGGNPMPLAGYRCF